MTCNKIVIPPSQLERLDQPGPFVVARTIINAMGYEDFMFGSKPYVHRTPHGAEEEARKLARRYDEKFSVFQRMYVVVPKVVETRTLTCDADALAGTLARQFQAANMHMSIESARAIVDRSLKEVIANGK